MSEPHAPDVSCHAPFISMEFDPSGNVFACCVNQLYPIGNVTVAGLDEIWHGARAGALRSAIARDDFSFGCNVCAWHIERGDETGPNVSYSTLPVTDLEPEWPTRMTFALSNRCNLACVMCNGELSSKIRAREGRAPLESPYGEAFFEQLDPYLEHLEYVNFLGGEPFLARENYRLFDRLAELDDPPLCHAVTNGTRFDDKVAGVLDKLDFSFHVSMDARTEETLASIRLTVDHAKVLANVEKFLAYTRERGTDMGFMFCLMEQNWFEFGQFLDWADSLDVDVAVIPVTEPGFCLHDLPTPELATVVESMETEANRRERELDRNLEVWRTQLESIRSVLSDRLAGAPVTIRQPQAVDGDVVPVGAARTRKGPRPSVVEQTSADRLADWAHGGAVARLDRDESGVITRAAEVDGVFGLDAGEVVGGTVDDALRRVAGREGRNVYVLDNIERGDGVVEQVLAVSERPVRGVPGLAYRVAAVPRRRGDLALVAVDRFWDGDPRPTVRG